MLRPKQLVPLYKATRTWLVAGTTCGTRTGDGSCNNPNGTCTSDEQGENGKRSTPALNPVLDQLQRIPSSPATQPEGSYKKSPERTQPVAFHATPIPSIYLKDTFGQAGKPAETSGLGQDGKVIPVVRVLASPTGKDATSCSDKVGLAVIGGLSSIENSVVSTTGSRSSNYRLPRQPSRTSSTAIAFEKGGKEVATAARAEQEVQSASVGNEGCSSITTARESQRRSGSHDTLSDAGGNSRVVWQARTTQSQSSTGQPFPVHAWSSSSGTVRRTSPALLPKQASVPGSVLEASSCTSKDEVPSWKGGDGRGFRAPRGVNHGRPQSGGRRHTHKAASEPRAATGEVVDHVCDILNQLNWRPETVDALSNLNARFNAFHINEVLKHQKEAGLALKFFNWAKGQSGFKHDVCTYTTMIGILGRARNFEACSRLLEEMQREGCEPSVVTYNRLIHLYGRANYLGQAVRIFHQMQGVGCSPDRVTYCTLIDLHSKAGFHDIAMDMYQQMQQAGFQPDTFTYSVIIHCLGKAGKVNAAYKLFQEMIEHGCIPSLVTYNIIIDSQAKAGSPHMAMKLYNDMQDAGFQPDRVTYSIMMEVLGQIGHIDEAELMFVEMEQAGWTADVLIYGLLIEMWGKAGNADKAWDWYKRMLGAGLTPNVQITNSLLGTYLRMQQIAAARNMLDSMKTWGLTPALQTLTILLSSCTASAHHQHQQVMGLMASTDHPASALVCSLLSVEVPMQELKIGIQQFFESCHGEAHDSKRGFTDALIEFLHQLGCRREAGLVWEVAREYNLYPLAVREKVKNQWSIDLHVMSIGTALVALSRTLSGLRETMVYTGRVPERIEIITGWGKHSRVTGSSLVRHAVQNMLASLGSPFYMENSNLGCFVSSGKPLSEWLHQKHVEQMLLL